ncbi:MAG TPA: hypothetical protein IAB12_01330 [Candidatus Ornithospirochaeta avicola]|uniref:Uncharacterized protein n=1 Tax=Candidatus Ornithospirochaeta avicola TaxID=2840896 RepID=A0A9D1PRL8_9SPIO|nr:hypothetical protein [Candidatus Ornithospirochaeta avicola]
MAIDWNATANMFGSIFGGLTGAYESYKNYELQKDNLEWQKYVQNQNWERADTAVQRRAADLQAAGLSKTLAAGSGAETGDVVSTSAPQSSIVDQLLKGMSLMKAMREADNVAAQTAQMEANTKYLQQQYATSQSQEALNYANAAMMDQRTEYYGVSTEYTRELVEQAEKRTEQILKDMEYTDEQIATQKEKYREAVANADMAELKSTRYSEILEAEIAAQKLDNDEKEMENAYMAGTGQHMGSSNSIAGVISGYVRRIVQGLGSTLDGTIGRFGKNVVEGMMDWMR